MKLLLVGHFSFDVVHTADGAETERPGGMYHAASMLSMLAGKNDTILPVSGVAKEDYARVSGVFSGLSNVVTDGLFKFDAPTNRVHLYPGPGGTSVVCSKDIAPPIPFEKLRRHLEADGILVNMLSGFDLALETLDQIRMAARDDGTPIHFDYHNLTLGVNQRHERYRRPVEAWRRWAFMVNSVQMNEEEAAGLAGEPMSEEQTAGHMLMLGVKGVLVTRAGRGLTVYGDEHKHVVRSDIGPAQVPEGADLTGSGDMLGAAFLYSYVKSKSMMGAAGDAVKALSQLLEKRGTEIL